MELIKSDHIQNQIFSVRGVQVMLDSDLALLYQTETKFINRAVKRNPTRFPEFFAFQLHGQEWEALRFQIGTLDDKAGRGQHRKYLPWVFTEQGVAMLSAVLNTERAIAASIKIPAALWFMSRCSTSVPTASGQRFRDRSKDILFIDARNLGHLINRRTRDLSQDDIDKITGTYHNWRNLDGTYDDIPGFCASAPISKVKELDYVLTPGRYVGLPDEEDDFNFAERFTSLKAELEEQLKEEAELNRIIAENLNKIQMS